MRALVAAESAADGEEIERSLRASGFDATLTIASSSELIAKIAAGGDWDVCICRLREARPDLATVAARGMPLILVTDDLERAMPLGYELGAKLCVASRADHLAMAVDGALRTSTQAYERSQRELLERMARGAPRDEILDEIALVVERRAPGMICSVMLFELPLGLVTHVSAPSLPLELVRGLKGMVLGPAGGSCGAAAHSGKPVITTDVATDPLWTSYKQMVLPLGLRACWSTPVRGADGRVIGTFAIYYGEPREPNARELGWIERATALVTVALQRERAADDLRASESELRAIFECSAIGMGALDDAGHVVRSNAALSEMLGYDEDELRGESIVELMLPSDSGAYLESLERMARGEIEHFRMEERCLKKDGSTLWARVTTSAIRGTRRGLFAICMVEDVTERKQLEAEMHRAERLKSLGALAGGVAHDFNNVLAGMLANADLAVEDLDDEHPARAPVEEVRSAGLRAAELVRRLLSFARQQEARRTPTRVDEIVDEVLGLLRATLPDNIRLETTLERDAPLVVADPTEMHQIVMNLVTNAKQAIGRREGRIDVRVERATIERATPARPSELPPGIYTRLRVEDTGAGMDHTTLERAFEPFFTTKADDQGTGLGLSVVHGVVASHGGGIVVETRPGEGATFTIYLPAS